MKKLFLSAAVLAMLASCQNEAIVEQSEMQQGGEFISLSISKGSESRTALGTPDANGITPTVWSEGDKIYVCGNNGKVAGELKLVSGANETSGIFEGYVFGGKQLDYVVFPVPEGGKTINMAAREEGKLDAPMVGTISGNTTASLNNVGGIIAFPSDKVYDVRAMVGENNMTGGSYEFNPATGELTYTPGDANDLTPAFKPEGSSDFVYVPVATAYIDNNGTSQTVANVAVEVLDGEAVISRGNMAVAANEIKGDEEGETTLPTISAWDGKTVDTSWYDETKPSFEITTAAELAGLAELVNSDMTCELFNGKTVKLMSNIDLGSNPWTPIGNRTPTGKKNGNDEVLVDFRGVFDGNGKTIANLKVNNNISAGLFGHMANLQKSKLVATIKNLTLKNVDIQTNHYGGAILGYGRKVNIENCTVDGGQVVVTPELIGEKYDNGDKAGGIAGYVQFSANLEGKLVGCTVKNMLIVAYRDLGGLIGTGQNVGKKAENQTGNFIENSVFDTELKADRTLENDYTEVKAVNMNEFIGYNNGTYNVIIAESNTHSNVKKTTITKE